MIEGVDVSSHQDHTPSLVGYEFLIARAAWGSVADTRYDEHVRAARGDGLLVGAYLFLRPGSVVDIRDQVDRFLETAGVVDGYAVDWERDRVAGAAATRAELAQAVELVQAQVGRCGVYASSSVYPNVGQDWRWVADYRRVAEPPVPWDVWQWTSTAGGLNLDRNRFRGTVDQLSALWRTPVTPKAITDERPGVTIDIAAGADLFDVDGRTKLGDAPAALAGRPSPYAAGSQRATYATIGIRRIVLVTPAAVHTPPPVVDCDDVVTRELDAAAVRAAAAVRSRP